MGEGANLGGIMTAAIWVGSCALVLMVVTVVWGFARLVEYSKRLTLSSEQIQLQLSRIHESVEDLRGDIHRRKV